MRAGRIGVLSASIFGVGYSAGVSDVLADPVEFRRKKVKREKMNHIETIASHIYICYIGYISYHISTIYIIYYLYDYVDL